ncbi:MAG: hypothetical protein PUB10_00640 [Clostridiales bacterium]|nr:hypothetical protein [Clostridiales bacterium]
MDLVKRVEELDYHQVEEKADFYIKTWDGEEGLCMAFSDKKLGDFVTFPYWDDVNLMFAGMEEDEIPMGTKEKPFLDEAEDWQLLIFADGAYVYIFTETKNPDCFFSGKVEKKQYRNAWKKLIRCLSFDFDI